MACFIVPATEAVVATIASKRMKKETEVAEVQAESSNEEVETVTRIPFSKKLKWLTNMLWGGSALLAFEHVWHGEVVPWPPFLTAAANPADAMEMLHEMATTGVCMAVLVTLVWGVMLLVTHSMEQEVLQEQNAERR